MIHPRYLVYVLHDIWIIQNKLSMTMYTIYLTLLVEAFYLTMCYIPFWHLGREKLTNYGKAPPTACPQGLYSLFWCGWKHCPSQGCHWATRI